MFDFTPRYVGIFNGTHYAGVIDTYDAHVFGSLNDARAWLRSARSSNGRYRVDHWAVDGTNAPTFMPGVEVGDSMLLAPVRSSNVDDLAQCADALVADGWYGATHQLLVTPRTVVVRRVNG